jgi:uncharacterized membrane protein
VKNKLIISLTLLVLFITACGGLATQVSPGPAAPTQTVTRSTSASTLAGPATDATTPATEAPAASVSFTKDVKPILVNSCNECHGGKQVKEGLDMRTYESLMAGSINGPVLIAGNSADSLLVQQVIKGKMPKRGPKLTTGQIQIISDWIDAGALNN